MTENLVERAEINEILADLSVEEKIGQILMPNCVEHLSVDEIEAYVEKYKVGGIFVAWAKKEQLRTCIGAFQKFSRVPVLVAADLECGAGHIVEGAVRYPDPLAVGAANDENLAYEMGRATAIEGLQAGINWSFSPIVDLNMNPDNPITCTRSFGDDPDKVIPIAKALIRGMQDAGMAACAKHFPGDGVDDRDQHIVTTVNDLTEKEWYEKSGRVFQAMYTDAQVMTTMVGHIALPFISPEQDERGVFCPASVDPKIVGLIRERLGFKGLIITDDMNMGGVSAYMTRSKGTVACVNAGCDMVLFPRLPKDPEVLKKAVETGTLPMERLDDAVRRVLALKMKLGLFDGDKQMDAVDSAEMNVAAKQLAESAVTLVRNMDGLLPLKTLKPGAKVLTVTLGNHENWDVSLIDEALRARGFDVEHMRNQEIVNFVDKSLAYDAVFINFVFRPDWCYSSVRAVGAANRMFWNSFVLEHPCTVFTSFGSPYHLRTFSTLPNYINVYSISPDSQRAAVKGWFGELPMDAVSPVKNLTRTFCVG